MFRIKVTAIYYDNSRPSGFLAKPFVVLYETGEGTLEEIIEDRARFVRKQIKQFVGFDYNGQMIRGLTKRKKKAYDAYKNTMGTRKRVVVRGAQI